MTLDKRPTTRPGSGPYTLPGRKGACDCACGLCYCCNIGHEDSRHIKKGRPGVEDPVPGRPSLDEASADHSLREDIELILSEVFYAPDSAIDEAADALMRRLGVPGAGYPVRAHGTAGRAERGTGRKVVSVFDPDYKYEPLDQRPSADDSGDAIPQRDPRFSNAQVDKMYELAGQTTAATNRDCPVCGKPQHAVSGLGEFPREWIHTWSSDADECPGPEVITLLDEPKAPDEPSRERCGEVCREASVFPLYPCPRDKGHSGPCNFWKAPDETSDDALLAAQAEVERYRADNTLMAQHNADLVREVASARDALQRIFYWSAGKPGIEAVWTIARDALAGVPDVSGDVALWERRAMSQARMKREAWSDLEEAIDLLVQLAGTECIHAGCEGDRKCAAKKAREFVHRVAPDVTGEES